VRLWRKLLPSIRAEGEPLVGRILALTELGRLDAQQIYKASESVRGRGLILTYLTIERDDLSEQLMVLLILLLLSVAILEHFGH